MKITDIKYKRLKAKLDEPFVIAFSVIEYAETIIVKITTDEGIVGYGEASPLAQVTGETLDSVPIFLDLFKATLIGQDPVEIEKAHKIMNSITFGNSSAKAGIDIALHDIVGKKMGMPLYKILGGYGNTFDNDMTVGIGKPADMARSALHYVKDGGFRIIKIKAGINPEDDVESVRLIRQAVGNGVRLRVDANQGWNVNTAIKVIREYEKYEVESVEQPLVYWDVDGMAYVREHTNISIMADESLHSPEDAMRLAKVRAADIFNIKLMKCGGLYPAMRINAIAESSGIPCMLGCMLETRLGTTAAACIVSAQKNITDADLDSYIHFDESELRDVVSGGFTMKNGIATMPETPGIGVEVDF